MLPYFLVISVASVGQEIYTSKLVYLQVCLGASLVKSVSSLFGLYLLGVSTPQPCSLKKVKVKSQMHKLKMLKLYKKWQSMKGETKEESLSSIG